MAFVGDAEFSLTVTERRDIFMIEADEFGIRWLERGLGSDVASDTVGVSGLDNEALGGFGRGESDVCGETLEIGKCGCGGKAQSSKHQAPEKHQIPSSNRNGAVGTPRPTTSECSTVGRVGRGVPTAPQVSAIVWSFHHYYFGLAAATLGFSFFGGTMRKMPPWAMVCGMIWPFC